jgi:dTDP-4-amino-4,6-dideoxygalactose transaminase
MLTRATYLAFGKPDFGDAEVEAVTRVLRSSWIGMGPETLAFEHELSDFIGARHVITLNSCTSALFLSLLAHGVGKGDEVICPSLTWCATANAALYLGARPVFCDIDPYSLCVTPATILAQLSRKTKAVMVVHYGGLAADVTAIRRVLPRNVFIVEDAAHALGAQYAEGHNVGTADNLTCFSFYANKNLSTGEGGAIALLDAQIADRLRSLRQNGLNADAWKRYSHPQTALVPAPVELGYKMNFTDLNAAIGRVQLKRQEEFRERRLKIAQRYVERLGHSGMDFEFQRGILDDKHARHLFVALLPLEKMSLSRNEFVLKMRERNVGVSIHYSPLHLMPFYRIKRAATLLETTRIAERIVTLPISASMSIDDVDFVIDNVIDLCSNS